MPTVTFTTGMAETFSELGWVVLGSLLIAAGSGMAGLFAFENRVLPVFAGFLLFFLGYLVSQFGVHRGGPSVDPRRVARPSAGHVARLGLLVLGGFGTAYGVTLFTQTILDPSPTNAVLSGVSSIGGYMFAHVGMNGNLL